ncbi:V-set and immunoglobulin domain-containing protein 1-like, partial [Poeciliopsis prolifica]|uniref:V-set and immunoglobulin domain-containing protein 1-like n=1 Tax=Poeciliopsis prolifica TaxID=188132 RepID=UPI00241427B6
MMIAALIISVLFLTCGSASTETAATFVVNVTQSSYQAEEKQNITLEWTFTTKTQGTWKNLFIICSLETSDKELVLYEVNEGVEIPESQDDQFSGRVQSDKDVLREGRIRLHVSRLRTEDSGLYLCDVKTEDGFNSGRCRLNVTVPVKVIGHDLIHAKVGDDVILPCHLEPPLDVNILTIEWRFKDEIIHVQRSQTKDDGASDPKYINRTFMFPDEFKKGNISLKLTKVTKEDEGNYICFVPKLQSQVRKGNVTLILDENAAQRDSTDTRVPDAGVIVGTFVGGAVLAALIIIMIFCVVRCCRSEPNHR